MTTDTEQRAKWLEMAQRKTRGIAFDTSGIEVYTLGAESYLSICEHITADAIAAERSRLAAAGEMTDGEVARRVYEIISNTPVAYDIIPGLVALIAMLKEPTT